MGEIRGELHRIRGPHLTEMIYASLPITTRCLKRGDLLVIPINILYSVEKPEYSASQGDIVYEPNSKSLIIPLRSTTFDNKVARIGKIVNNFPLFEQLKGSTGIRLERFE